MKYEVQGGDEWEDFDSTKPPNTLKLWLGEFKLWWAFFVDILSAFPRPYIKIKITKVSDYV